MREVLRGILGGISMVNLAVYNTLEARDGKTPGKCSLGGPRVTNPLRVDPGPTREVRSGQESPVLQSGGTHFTSGELAGPPDPPLPPQPWMMAGMRHTSVYIISPHILTVK